MMFELKKSSLSYTICTLVESIDQGAVTGENIMYGFTVPSPKVVTIQAKKRIFLHMKNRPMNSKE